MVLSLQMYSDYQIQQMSENFVDTFGYNDEDFNDAEDGVRLVSVFMQGINWSFQIFLAGFEKKNLCLVQARHS